MGWWILLPIVAAAAYIAVVALLLPKFFLQNKYKIKQVQDRGIKKYKSGDSARGIVYEPDLSLRKYIKQYALADDGKEKSLKCMISPDIEYMEYDIALFNNRHKVFKVLNICDIITEKGYTEKVILPDETSYVMIIPSRINNEILDRPVRLNISYPKTIAFGFITLILSVVVAFALKIGLTNALGGVFRESFLRYSSGHVETLIAALVLCVIGIIVVAVMLSFKNMQINKHVAKKVRNKRK